MRRLGTAFAAMLLAASVVAAQAPPPAPGRLDVHLGGWEKEMGRLVNLSASFERTRKDAVFLKERQFEGSLLWMKPNLARLSIKSKADPQDHEGYVCNGKAVYQYDARRKTVTEYRINPGDGADDLLLSFLGGMTAADAKKRFTLALLEEGTNYVTLDIRPVLARDKQEFAHARMALLAPTNEAKFPAYLPYDVWKQLPNGDTEEWKLRRHVTNAKDVTPKHFAYEAVAGWTLQQAPTPPR